MVPGEFILAKDPIKCNEKYESITISVTNRGDRAVQVGSHFHFYEVNTGLEFDREKAYGKRLDIPSGSGVRFEPGDTKEVNLIDLGGERRVFGFDNKVDGFLD
ncbi:urease subunit beta [Clostridium sardiniense]|uniref:urease subunit beta n=1 Tax=Clostridium sardiniense TaxID=29369 RepID=UPI003D352A84